MVKVSFLYSCISSCSCETGKLLWLKEDLQGESTFIDHQQVDRLLL